MPRNWDKDSGGSSPVQYGSAGAGSTMGTGKGTSQPVPTGGGRSSVGGISVTPSTEEEQNILQYAGGGGGGGGEEQAAAMLATQQQLARNAAIFPGWNFAGGNPNINPYANQLVYPTVAPRDFWGNIVYNTTNQANQARQQNLDTSIQNVPSVITQQPTQTQAVANQLMQNQQMQQGAQVKSPWIGSENVYNNAVKQTQPLTQPEMSPEQKNALWLLTNGPWANMYPKQPETAKAPVTPINYSTPYKYKYLPYYYYGGGGRGGRGGGGSSYGGGATIDKLINWSI